MHLFGIQVTGTSVNPARSLGAAIFADSSFDAMSQLWVFIVFPIVGAVIGAAAWKVLVDKSDA